MDVARLELLTTGAGGFVAVATFWFNFNVELEGSLLLLIGEPTVVDFFSDHLVFALSVSIITLSDCVQDFCLGLIFLRLHSRLSILFGPSVMFRLVLISSFCSRPSTPDLTLLWAAGNLRKLLEGFESFDSSLINLIFSFTFSTKGDFVPEMIKVLDRGLRGADDKLSWFWLSILERVRAFPVLDVFEALS